MRNNLAFPPLEITQNRHDHGRGNVPPKSARSLFGLAIPWLLDYVIVSFAFSAHVDDDIAGEGE